MQIHLQDLSFFAYHGVFKEEQVLGNTFIVNVKVEINNFSNAIISLSETVNYEDIFNIVKQEMDIPTPLLENLVVSIGSKILSQFLQIQKVQVSIYKKNPPIKAYQGNVGVEQIFERI